MEGNEEVMAMITTYRYLELKVAIIEAGYAWEVEWAENVQPVSDPLAFWLEFAWVVLNSGMKNTIARQIWGRVRPHVLSGGSALDVFGHKGKATAIDQVYRDREDLLRDYLQAPDDEKIAWLRGLPWIGAITQWHLAKNLGHDVAKPDRHLVRIAGCEGVNELCSRLATAAGDRVATVDLVLWRAASLGMV